MPDMRRIHHIQALRAAAALLVIVAHIGRELTNRGASDPFKLLQGLATCQFGVDIFFVISGFIMYHVVVGKPAGFAAARSFIKKRIIRIVPLYWIYTLLLLLPILMAPETVRRTGYSIAYIVASLLFIPWPRPGAGDVGPLLAVGWTLNYEMLFYLIFAVLIALRIRMMVLVLLIIFGALIAAGNWVTVDYPQLWYWTRSSLIEFAFGTFIAMTFHRGIVLPKWVGIVILGAGIALWQGSTLVWPVEDPGLNVRGFTWGIAAALVVGGISLTPALASAAEAGGPGGLPQQIGDSSYSLYLCHMFVVRACTLAFGGIALTGVVGVVAFFAIAVAACVTVAMISYRFLEVPLIRFARRDIGAKPVIPVNESTSA